MEIEIVSEDNVKPLSPTPPHLKTYKLSILDQLNPSGHVPILIFYKPINLSDIPSKLKILKQSLSQTLTLFYPFAGKTKDDLYIDCNDDGVYYVEANVGCCLSDILISPPDGDTLSKLLPVCDNLEWSGYVAMIQVNVFKCGGIAIGTKTSHKIIDGPTSGSFLKAWASTAANDSVADTISPNFAASSLFPQNQLLPKDTLLGIWPSLIKFGRCVTKRFVFDASAISTLKANATGDPCFVKNITRVEVVSAFIWQCFISASKTKHGNRRPSVLSLVVNLRTKRYPELNQHSVGNLLWMATATINDQDSETELNSMVQSIRNSITKIDADFIDQLKGQKGFARIRQSLNELEQLYLNPENTDYIHISSLCKLGIYESDFGFGKPMWVRPGGISSSKAMMVYQNLVFLFETGSNGDGIESWVTLDEEFMEILERDTQILNFASLEPSPPIQYTTTY